MMVIIDKGGGGMELTVPIVIVDGGICGLSRQRLPSTEAAVGWIRRWPCPVVMAPTQRSLASRYLSTLVVVDGGNGGMESTVSIVVVDDGDGGHCRLRRRSIAATAIAVFFNDGHHQWRRRWDGANGTAPIVILDSAGKDTIAVADDLIEGWRGGGEEVR